MAIIFKGEVCSDMICDINPYRRLRAPNKTPRRARGTLLTVICVQCACGTTASSAAHTLLAERP